MTAERDDGLLTVVIPVFDEVDSLDRLHRALTVALGGLRRPSEIIYVDDGSTDGSAAMLDSLAARDPRVRIVRLRRNFGKSAALDAGFRNVRGAIVITLDADMQNDPADIPRFIEKIEQGTADAVSGWRRQRHDGAGKVMPSGIFNSVVRWISGSAIHDFNCGFKAYRAECLAGLRLRAGWHRYILVLLHWSGYVIDEIEVTHHARLAGRSKFGAGRLLISVLDLLAVLLSVRFQGRPLHFFGYAALGGAAIGLLAMAYGFMTSGFSLMWSAPVFVALLFFLAAALSIGVGLIGELLKSLLPSATPDYVVHDRAPAAKQGEKTMPANVTRLAR